ncbi:MAG: hypothetical protein PW844_17065 [Pantoea sp.]|uniref:hypothetical protein n=1 Tax=Pantoea sp. TaxID=69393 RepID=UPI0023832ED1|nr:hypothetical protein [Pantoea sp.]MDE1188178.1 hypothetical protein [Pantoea sp.]
MGFPSPAADYQESALNLNEIMISHPSATILVPTANGWLLVDKSISPVRGNQLYFLLWGQEKIGVLRHNSIICTDGEEVRGEALEEITVVGVITWVITRHWDRESPTI